MLNAGEGIGESCLRLVYTSNVTSKQEVSGSVEGKPEEHVRHVHLPLTQLVNQLLHMLFENVDIAQPVFDELWANQLSRVVPELSISVENTCSSLALGVSYSLTSIINEYVNIPSPRKASKSLWNCSPLP